MAEIHRTGRLGENLAREYLMHQGYDILDLNWQSGHKELDIVASKGGVVVFVEVKTRAGTHCGEPESFITRHKQHMLIQAANHYLHLHGIDQEARFDIISVVLDKGGHDIRHIPDAFYPH